MKNRIAELRAAKGLSQSELAELLGTTRNQLGKLERNERRLSDHWAGRIAPVLGINAYELFMNSENAIDPTQSVPLLGATDSANWRKSIGCARAFVPAFKEGESVFAIGYENDSANQVLSAGGYAYVDPEDQELAEDRIYAISTQAGSTSILRFKTGPARLCPCSDNPVYPTISVGKDVFTVIGRVVGIYNSV